MKLTFISPGDFVTGTPSDLKDRGAREDQRQVSVNQSFYMGIFEVTRGEFRQFVSETKYLTSAQQGPQNDGEYRPLGGGYRSSERVLDVGAVFDWQYTGFDQTDDHPVVNVSALDAKAFCKWLSDKESKKYRLPTEEEWEFACRAGTTTVYSFGDDPAELVKHGNVEDASWTRAKIALDEQSKTRDGIEGDDGFVFTAPVGRFSPNAFGLYDMHGNVFEFCTSKTTLLQLRGGAWFMPAAKFCRSGNRFAPLGERQPYFSGGFRIVRE